MLRFYFAGIIVLLIAIFANVLAGWLGFMSWYDAVLSLQKNGIGALKQWKWQDYLWLFILYPLILGFAAIMSNRMYELLVK
jgi:hypothetical protein